MTGNEKDFTRVDGQPLVGQGDLPRPATSPSEQLELAIGAMLLWAQTKGDFGLAADIGHSSLLRRLLSGKPLLPTAPPRAFSYPWYELIENGRADHCEVWIDHTRGRIIINQSDQFELLSSIGGEHRVRFNGVEYRVFENPNDHPSWNWSIRQIAHEAPQVINAVDPHV